MFKSSKKHIKVVFFPSHVTMPDINFKYIIYLKANKGLGVAKHILDKAKPNERNTVCDFFLFEFWGLSNNSEKMADNFRYATSAYSYETYEVAWSHACNDLRKCFPGIDLKKEVEFIFIGEIKPIVFSEIRSEESISDSN